jgi:hypothetical protein
VALVMKVAFWDMMMCNQVHSTDILEHPALSIFKENYTTLKIWALFSFETLVSIPEDVNLHFPFLHTCALPDLIPGRDSGAIYMYVGNSKSKVPYFIPTERIPPSSWQKWVLLVCEFTTI